MNYRERKKRFSVPYCIFHIPSRGGFGLIELLIAVSVFGLIVSFVLLAYGEVSERLFMSTLGYEVALSIRQAQSFGVSVKQYFSNSSPNFEAGYGIHINNGQNNQYVLFADEREGDTPYDYKGKDEGGACISATECVSVFKIAQGNFIERFCAVRAVDGGVECSDDLSGGISYLNVLFFRPNPDAVIVTSKRDEDGRHNLSEYQSTRVYLRSPRSGTRRMVEVWNTGQISIK